MSAKDPRSEVVAKAVKDAAFRAELKKDPARAIEQAVGVKLPAGVSVKVVEDSASVVHLVLPPSGELDEKALGRVAGGISLNLYPTQGNCLDQCSNSRAACTGL